MPRAVPPCFAQPSLAATPWLLATMATLATLVALPSQAAPVVDSLFFVTLGQNPYQPGPASNWSDVREVSVPLSRADGPTVRFPPPPSPVYARAGVRTDGFGGFELQTRFNSGMLDIRYPVASVLSIPDADSVRTGGAFSLSLGGNARPLFDVGSVVSASATLDSRAPRAFGGTTGLVAPGISTTFPSLSAQLDVFYQQRNSAFIEGCAGLGPLEKCADIVRGDLPSFPRIQQTVASFGPQGVYLLPGTSAQAGYRFGDTLPVGPYGNLQINYPSVATRGSLVDATRLSSFGEQKLVQFDLDIDKLIDDVVLRPALLPTLQGSFGPAQYSLLDLTGSAFLTLYQSFSYDPRLRVNLEFNNPVSLNGGAPTYRLDLRAGETLTGLRVVNAFADTVTVRPRYFLDGELVSETGIGFGAGIDAKALKLDLGSLSTGWAAEGSAEAVFGRLKLVGDRFAPVMPAVQGRDFVIDFDIPQFRQTIDADGSRAFDALTGRGTGLITVYDAEGRAVDEGRAVGRFLDAAGRPFSSSFGVTYTTTDAFFVPDSPFFKGASGEEYRFEGDFLCAVCLAHTLADPVSAALIELADGTVIRASDAPDDIDLLPDGPSLSGGTLVGAGVQGTRLDSWGPIDPALRQALGLDGQAVPAPGSVPLVMLAGLAMLSAARRRPTA